MNFVWHHTKIFMQNLSQWCVRNVQLLRITMNWCWWRFTHTSCRSSNILRCTYCFWLFTLWFIDEDASFFQFFHKITNIWSWRCFSSSKNPYEISAYILQHYHDFQSNVAIFPSFVQAYTQPYSHRTHRMNTRFWRLLGNYERDSKYYQKICLSLSDSFCFVYICFVNYWSGFLFSILVEIDDIFVG